MTQGWTSIVEAIDFPELSLQGLVSVVASSAIMFGGVVPYIPQYFDIKKTRNADGFSTFVCLTLLIANTLRVLFWFGHKFEYPLLIQSVIMIVTMLAMVQICTLVKTKSEIIASKPRLFTDSRTHSQEDLSSPHHLSSLSESTHLRCRLHSLSVDALLDPNLKIPDGGTQDLVPEACKLDFDRRHFWQWTHFSSYLEFMGVFSLIMGLITWILLDVMIYVEVLGFLAVLFEALLGAPQFYRNLQNKSTKGMSVKMVLMWTCGDIFKTIYFVVKQSPIQFWVCGLLQIGLDMMILGQVYYYSSLTRP